MNKTLRKINYDTETATFICKNTVGSYGDPTGYEECLFVTEKGNFFLYKNGGEESIYPMESIEAYGKARADEFRAKYEK